MKYLYIKHKNNTKISVGMTPMLLDDHVILSSVRVRTDAAESKADVEALVREIWNYPEGGLEVTPVHGGITNRLFKVAKTNTDAKASTTVALVRVFGKAGDVLIDRENENVVFRELAASGFAPACVAIFANGRVEEWFDGRRPVEPAEMMHREVIKTTARRLAVLHGLKPSGDKNPRCWGELDMYYTMARKVSVNSPRRREALALINFDYIAQELDFCKGIIPSPKNAMGTDLMDNASTVEKAAMDIIFAVVFCHKDLLGANCLIPVDKSLDDIGEDMKIIDFEYSAYDFVGTDIANHFNAVPESFMIVQHTFDMAQFPPVDTRRRFLQHYLEARGIALPSEDVLDAAAALCLRFSLVTELRWGLWAIIQVAHSALDFDYVSYARQRLLAYDEFKSML
eukprot:GEMP01039167.1.p1 GENE.GEMP01039167.1~~GEMP01039167.1.p1  ORF type:complete len:398 (+),score=91.62 GEMP01039167.1:90-1283(+)